MKNTHFSLALMVAVLGGAGCGDGGQAPPPEVMAPRTSSAPPSNKPLTKEEKIERIKNAPISEDQKKAAIAKVNSDPD